MEAQKICAKTFERHLSLEGAFNFRDVGGYQTLGGRSLKTGTLFRSGELHHITERDVAWLRNDLKIRTVLDLRTPEELASSGLGGVSSLRITHHSIPFTRSLDEDLELLNTLAGMGEFYLEMVSRKSFGDNLMEALNIIASSESHPLAFHCSVGKDRTGVLAALLQGVLGVSDDDIIADYALSHEPATRSAQRAMADPQTSGRLSSLPSFTAEARPEFMQFFLSALAKEYGSVRGYVEAQGEDAALFLQLENALLE